MSPPKSILPVVIVVLLLASCAGDDADYKSGIYWLNERDNWQSAVQAFERSLAKHPDRWKPNLAMIEALSRGEDKERVEKQLSIIFERFPDSTRSVMLTSASANLLGDERVAQLGGKAELDALEDVLLRNAEDPKLLSRAVIAACRAADQTAVSLHLGDLLGALKGEIPDSVRNELNFFIGPARLNLILLASRLESNPDDPHALLEFAGACLLNWDIPKTRNSVITINKKHPEILRSEDVAARFAGLWDILPFESKVITFGWDGSRLRGESTLVFLRDLGDKSDPDRYIFRNSGGSDVHTMKALQQNLHEIAMPRYSPDGAWIYFYSSADKNWRPGGSGRFNLYRVKPTYGSAPVKLTDDDLIYCEPFIERDGGILLVRRDIGSVRQSAEVFRVLPEQRRSESVIRIADPVQWAAFTPQADTLLYITSRGIFKRALTGGTVTVEMAGQGFSYPVISPDGKWLLLQGPGNEQILIDRPSKTIIYLGIAAAPMGWFGTNGELFVTRARSGRLQVVSINLNQRKDVSGELLADIGAN